MSKNIWRFTLVLALCLRFVSSNQQHFVCKNIKDVFTDDGSVEAEPRYGLQQGPPGKMGPPGAPGPIGTPGNDGPSGIVDYDRMKKAIGIEVDNYLGRITSRNTELTRNLSVLTIEIDCIKQGGLLLTERCFTVPYLSSSTDITNYEKAVAECTKHGALVAEFQDRAQQNAVEDLVRRIMPYGLSYVEFYLGMKYNLSTSHVLYRSGIEVDRSHLQWLPSYPSTRPPHEYMFLQVRRAFSPRHGVWNYISSHAVHGVICENRI